MWTGQYISRGPINIKKEYWGGGTPKVINFGNKKGNTIYSRNHAINGMFGKKFYLETKL